MFGHGAVKGKSADGKGNEVSQDDAEEPADEGDGERLGQKLEEDVAAARAERPDALILIDFSGFNFRLAPSIRRFGVPVVYYISPQIWASRPGRLATIRAIADRVLVIFPFEEAIYRDGGVPVERVLELGLGVDEDRGQFDMTAFSLRLKNA